jgi:hypothetical protein
VRKAIRSKRLLAILEELSIDINYYKINNKPIALQPIEGLAFS